VLRAFERTYIRVFRAYPFLLGLAGVVLLAEFAYASINNVIVSYWVSHDGARLGVDPLREGWVLGSTAATFLIVETFLRLPAGALSDRWGRRVFIVGAPLLTCFSPVLLAGVTHYWAFYPLRAVDGLGAAALWPSVFALVGDRVARDSRAHAMSVINMIYIGGLALGLWGSNLVIGLTRSVAPALYVCGAMLAAAGTLALLTVPSGAAEAAGADPQDDTVAARPTTPWRTTAMLVVTAGQTFSVVILAPYLEAYVTRDLGIPAHHLGLIFVIPGAAVLLTAMPFGRLGDRVGKGLLAKVGMASGALTLWVMAGVLLTVPEKCGLLALIGLATPLALSYAASMPPWFALLTELAPRRSRGFALAYFGTAHGVGASVAVLLAGRLLWDRLGHESIFVGAAAGMTLCALLAAVAVRSD